MASYEFDEYGRRLATSETGASTQKTFVGGMSVQDEVADTGLMMMGHRFYAPDHGRFLNRDPIGFAGGLNLFSYGGNNPVSKVDYTGLQPPEHMMDRRVGIHNPNEAYIHPDGSLHALLLSMFFEPIDWAMMAYEIKKEGFSPWMLMAVLPIISYGLFKGGKKLNELRAARSVGTVCNDPASLALGLNKHLFDFADKMGAKTWADYLPDMWWDTVTSKLDDGTTRILFNTEGWDAGKAMDNLLAGTPGATDTEFQWIMERYNDIRERVSWHNGKNPIQPGFNER